MSNKDGKLDFQQPLFNSERVPSVSRAITRPIHYLGSKLRVIDKIRETINSLDPTYGPLCDLFAGSGTVSKALSKERDVIAVDIQEYSRVLCSAILCPAGGDINSVDEFVSRILLSEHSKMLSWSFEPLKDFENECLNAAALGDIEPLCDLLESGSFVAFELGACHTLNPSLITAMKKVQARLSEVHLRDSPGTIVTRYFGGIYFSYLQASQLDSLLDAVSKLRPDQKDSYLAAVLSTASEIVNTIGKQFAQPLRPRSSSGNPKPNLLRLVSRDRSSDVIDLYQSWLNRYITMPRTAGHHEVIRHDYLEALKSLKGKVRIIYADPPYTRDHYSRYYHVLETMCFRDNPRISTVRINGEDLISRGIYRLERYQSPFCIHSKAPKAFASLFEGVRWLDVPLVLSYSPYDKRNNSRPRLMTIGQIEELARAYFSRVEIRGAGHISHNKLTSSDKTFGISYDAEVLFICEP